MVAGPLLISTALFAALAGPLSASSGDCSTIGTLAGHCHEQVAGANGTDATAISITQHRDADSSKSAASSDKHPRNTGPTGPPPPPPPRVVPIGGLNCSAIQDGIPIGVNEFCAPRTDPGPTAPPPAAGAPELTLADVASFAPSPGELVAEPNGWAIVGADANFFATAAPQDFAGTLVGRPVAVRFTPVGYVWDYGDGSSRQTASPGRSWNGSRIPEFTATPTSHRYDRAGDYVVHLTVRMRADYAFDGGGWTTIDGTLDLPTAPVALHVATADTVLVDHPCRPGATDPGC